MLHVVDGGAGRKEFSLPQSSGLGPTPVAKSLTAVGQAMHTGALSETASRQSTSKRSRKDYRLVKFVVIWFSLLLLVAIYVKWNFDERVAELPLNSHKAELEKVSIESMNLDVMNESKNAILQTAAEFFQASAPETLAQSCRNRPRLAQTIYNDGAKAGIFKPEEMPVLRQVNVIRPGGVAMVETIWQDQRERKVELVFAKEENRWVIDWEAYAKSSSMPWAIFQSGEGEASGNFRLLVRERSVSQNQLDLTLSIVFYEPGFLHGSPVGQTTPEFVIRRDSDDGKMILAAIKARKEDAPIYGSMFPAADPPNTARVHVKIQRRREKGEIRFTLEKVIACHWLGIDDSGVDLTDAP